VSIVESLLEGRSHPIPAVTRLQTRAFDRSVILETVFSTYYLLAYLRDYYTYSYGIPATLPRHTAKSDQLEYGLLTILERNPLEPLAGVRVPGAPKESRVGRDNCRLATIVTSWGRATTIFLS
jgi:hypothetical protein